MNQTSKNMIYGFGIALFSWGISFVVGFKIMEFTNFYNKWFLLGFGTISSLLLVKMFSEYVMKGVKIKDGEI